MEKTPNRDEAERLDDCLWELMRGNNQPSVDVNLMRLLVNAGYAENRGYACEITAEGKAFIANGGFSRIEREQRWEEINIEAANRARRLERSQKIASWITIIIASMTLAALIVQVVVEALQPTVHRIECITIDGE